MICMWVDIRQKYKDRQIGTSDLNSHAVKNADVIVLAVKPQMLKDVRRHE